MFYFYALESENQNFKVTKCTERLSQNVHKMGSKLKFSYKSTDRNRLQ